MYYVTALCAVSYTIHFSMLEGSCDYAHSIFFFFLILGEEAHTVQHEGSYFPEWELNLCPWQWKHRVLTTEPPGNSLDYAHFT